MSQTHITHTHTHAQPKDFHWDARAGGKESHTLVHCPKNKKKKFFSLCCYGVLLSFYVCVFVCVSCASQEDVEQLHVVCVCVSDSGRPDSLSLSPVWTHGEPSSSFASYQSTGQMTNTHTHTHSHTHTHTMPHSLHILLLLCLDLRGARCEAHAHACVPQTGVYMCVCACVCVSVSFICVIVLSCL